MAKRHTPYSRRRALTSAERRSRGQAFLGCCMILGSLAVAIAMVWYRLS